MIKELLTKKFVRDNLVLFTGTLILNVFGFLFHFYMGRSLGPEGYGILGALLSIVYFMIVPTNTIQTGIAKFSMLFNAKKEYGKIRYLFAKSVKRLLLTGIIGGIIFALMTPFIADFLNMDVSSLVVISFFMLFALLVPINRGILQGVQDFKSLSVNLAVEGVIKLLAGVLFVALGYGVNGALGAIIASYIVVFFIGLKPLSEILKKESSRAIDTREVYSYSLPLLIMVLSLTLFYSVDMVLVKHFFSSVDAGYYSAISLIGKILFFGSMSISQVMFPKVAELHHLGKEHKKLMYKSLGVIFLLVIPAVIIYFLIPDFIITLLYGKEYLPISPLLGWFGLFIGLVCFIYLIAFYNISINKKKFLWILGLFNLIEISAVWFFHNSLFQVIQSLTITMFLLFVILSIDVIFSKDGKNGKTIGNNPCV